MPASKLNSRYACAIVAMLVIVLTACSNDGGGGGGGSSGGGGGGGGSAPTPEFTATPTTTDIATPVNFTDNTTGNPTAWQWDFNNDSIVDSTAQHPSFTFSAPGLYTVSLTASNSDGANSISKSDYILVTSPPTANFTGTPTNPNTSTAVNFTDTSTGGPTAWQWDFNNDTFVDSTAQNPSHTYTSAGVYSVTLTVSNAGGSDSLTRTNYITVSAPPTANFTGTPTNPNTSTAVNFTDTSTGGPTSWQWDFNNDSVTDSTTQNPSHTYTTPGVYSVKLTVSNGAGSNSLTRTSYITVTSPSVGVADIDADTDRDGTIATADDTNENVWNASGGAVYYFNQDDDDNNFQEDYLDTVSAGNDPLDLARVMVRQFINPPAGGSVLVTVSTTAQARVRLFRLNGSAWTQVYTSGGNFSLPIADIGAGDITLGIEARDRMSSSWDGRVTLTLEVRNSGGTIVGTDTVILRVAPPIFATNLWTAEEYHLVNVGSGFSGNLALRTAMQNICAAGGIQYREAAGSSYSNDRWLQDSSEAAVIQLPDSSAARRVIDNVFQCSRHRPCDDWCEDVLWNPNFDFFRRFTTDTQNSLNYGGNFEVVPPYTGKPYGRIMVGGGNGTLVGTSSTVNRHMDLAYRQLFDAAAIQGHFETTSEWLAVGHVDEFTMFVPAPNTSRGWVCLIASPDRGYQVLQATQTAGYGNAPVFAGRTTYSWATTVNAILADTALATLNGQVQARIDAARNQIKTATGMTDADFIELPTLFENVGSNYMAAYNPGVVNLICLPSTNGTVYFAIPDPEGPDIAGVDQFQADINTQLQALTNGGTPFNITYVDIFYSYHTNLGEAHCGSNFVRTPPNDDWWNK